MISYRQLCCILVPKELTRKAAEIDHEGGRNKTTGKVEIFSLKAMKEKLPASSLILLTNWIDFDVFFFALNCFATLAMFL